MFVLRLDSVQFMSDVSQHHVVHLEADAEGGGPSPSGNFREGLGSRTADVSNLTMSCARCVPEMFWEDLLNQHL